MPALILVAELPQVALDWTGQARACLAPQAAARSPPHLALFRHLPGPQVEALARDARRLIAGTPAPRVRFGAPAIRERAIVLPVTSPDLARLRATLADWWAPLLLAAEQAPPPLHVTIAAGLFPAMVRAARATLSQPPFINRALAVPALAGFAVAGDGSPWSPLFRAPFRG
jgi:hypothetical protein